MLWIHPRKLDCYCITLNVLSSNHADACVLMFSCLCSPTAQVFRLNLDGQLAAGELCVTLTYSRLSLSVCPRGSVSGPWKFHAVKFVI